MFENGPTTDGNKYNIFLSNFHFFSSTFEVPTIGHACSQFVEMRTADIKTLTVDYLKMKYYLQNKNSNLFPLSLQRYYTFVFAISSSQMRLICNNMKILIKI